MHFVGSYYIQYALHMLNVYHIFPHYFIHGTVFAGGEQKVTEHKMGVLFVSTTYVSKRSSFQEEVREILLKMYTRLRVKYSLLLPD